MNVFTRTALNLAANIIDAKPDESAQDTTNNDLLDADTNVGRTVYNQSMHGEYTSTHQVRED